MMEKRYIKPQLVVVQPSGQLEVIPDLEQAKTGAHTESEEKHQHRYVVQVEGGYVVCSGSDLWLYFGHSSEHKNVVYKITW